MGKFNGKISAQFTAPKTWVLEKTLSFKTDKLAPADIETFKEVKANVDNNGRVTCKTGMKTDLAFSNLKASILLIVKSVLLESSTISSVSAESDVVIFSPAEKLVLVVKFK